MNLTGINSTFFLFGFVLAVCLVDVPNAKAAFTFLSSSYAVGHAPNCVTAADVNSDGRLDLISANYTDNTLTILTNNGGGFGSNATLNVGKNPTSVVAADIRGIGKVDLICANYGAGGGKTLTIFTNDGNGIFGSNATLNAGLGPYFVTVGDLKGIGKLDLICANAGTNGNGTTLTIFTNNGSGVLVSNVALTVGSDPISIAVADVNGDGKMDLISANNLGNSLTVLTNRGNARFGVNATISVSAPVSVTATDVSGDGKPDLIYVSFPSSLVVLTNNGNGGFVSEVTLPTSGGVSFPLWATATDLNGDGRPDLICANTTNTIYGIGGLVIFTNNSSYRFGSNAMINVGSFPVCVVAADVNADGRPDLISANAYANTVTVLKNTNIFPASISTPILNLKSLANVVNVSWPSVSAGWSLEEISNLTGTNWLPSGYAGFPIADDGTNKSLTVPIFNDSRYFRLLHP
jgi:hypothetical protein